MAGLVLMIFLTQNFTKQKDLNLIVQVLMPQNGMLGEYRCHTSKRVKSLSGLPDRKTLPKMHTMTMLK